MNNTKPTNNWLLVTVLLVFLSTHHTPAQIGKRIKKKFEDKAVEVVDDELNGKKSKQQKEESTTDESVNMTGTKVTINKNFIKRNDLIFFDDFEGEKPGEFPRKWTHIDGTLETGEFVEKGNRLGVAQMVSTRSVMKPSFKEDSYLGNSFKIEIQSYFWMKGNEAYVIQLHGDKSSRPAYSLYLRSTNVAPGSDAVVYKAGKQSPGWSTAQISFNRGNLKVFVDGAQLVNNPDINVREFTHMSIYTLSPGSNSGDGYTKARINYVMIAKEGLPLYDRMVANGRIVVQDIHFDINKYQIKPESYKVLDEIVEMLKTHDNMEVTIEGHTDANGSNDDNLTLSEKRAEAVKAYLVDKGIKRYRLSSKGYGEERPIDPGSGEAAWSQNRRVEFVLASQ